MTPKPAPILKNCEDAPPPVVERECRALIHRADNAASARDAAQRIRELATFWPNAPSLGLAYALAMEKTRCREGMLELWTQTHLRFPDDPLALRYRLRWLARSRRAADGAPLVEERVAREPDPHVARLMRAQLLAELRDDASVRSILDDHLRERPQDEAARMFYARKLREWGEGEAALGVLAPMLAKPDAPRLLQNFARELRDVLDVLRRIDAGFGRDGAPLFVAALRTAVRSFERRKPRALPPDRLGSVALITGTLGAGGAERQLSCTAAMLETLRKTGAEIRGRSVSGKVHVVVKSHAAEGGHDFFLPQLLDNEIQITQINDITPDSWEALGVNDPDLLALLPFLPSGAIFGLRRLTRFFRENAIDVAYIWQDGAVLFAALAALLASVPRIVLNVRGLPPNLRKHNHRAEYADLYRTLAAVPGVRFITNAETVARAYCDWLDFPPERFSIIRNGVEPLPQKPTEADRLRWLRFEARTDLATETIGGVFRLDLDKRPLLWIDFAAAYLRARPRARFVIVGAGPLLQQCRERATLLGAQKRILFVGRSTTVGYWLTKMDAMVLLSQFEGLPNVLIEAQMTGVPVVSTPAGGAGEAFVPDVTGLLTRTVENLDMAALCEQVSRVVGWRSNDPGFSQRVRGVARERFSVEAMIERAIEVLCSDDEAAVYQRGQSDSALDGCGERAG